MTPSIWVAAFAVWVVTHGWVLRLTRRIEALTKEKALLEATVKKLESERDKLEMWNGRK